MGQKPSQQMGCASGGQGRSYAAKEADAPVSARLTSSSRSGGTKGPASQGPPASNEEPSERRRGEPRKPRVDCWRGDRRPLVREDEAPAGKDAAAGRDTGACKEAGAAPSQAPSAAGVRKADGARNLPQGASASAPAGKDAAGGRDTGACKEAGAAPSQAPSAAGMRKLPQGGGVSAPAGKDPAAGKEAGAAAGRPHSVAGVRKADGAKNLPLSAGSPQPGSGRRASGSVPAPKRDPARRSSAKGKGKGSAPKGPDLDEHEKALLNEVLETSPGVSWDAIAGLEEVKRLFWEIVVAPVKNPALFSGVRSPPRGVLLFGPPGNGKTMLAKAVASECDATFFSISASSLVSKWVGDSEKHMRALFSLAGKMQPSVIFMDEIDSMLTSRSSGEHDAARRLKTEFLVQLDGAGTAAPSTRILLLGATNRPGELDDAVLRRLPRRILIPLPESATRGLLVSKELQGTRHSLSQGDFTRLAGMTEGYSCSDLAALTREAAMGPVRTLQPEALVSATPEGVRAITLADFRDALQRVRPSVSKEVLSEFDKWNRSYGSR